MQSTFLSDEMLSLPASQGERERLGVAAWQRLRATALWRSPKVCNIFCNCHKVRCFEPRLRTARPNKRNCNVLEIDF